MKINSIVLIGGGASCVSFINSLYNEVSEKNISGLTIYVIESRILRGRGLAYDMDSKTNILNTRAGFITPFSEKPGHFYEWLQSNKEKWEEDFPEISICPDLFVPRPLFGLYLEYMMSDFAGKFAQLGVQLVHVRGEATEINRLNGNQHIVVTNTSLKIVADHVVMCCGNLQSNEYKNYERFEGFHASPYPIRKLARSAHKKKNIAILGARLSAIDVALGLANAGYDGQMTMFSRSGYFPSVRGTQGRYQAKIMTLNTLQEHHRKHGKLSLSQLVDWTMQELALAGEAAVRLEDIPPAPPLDIRAYFMAEIAAAASPRPWQAVLYATNSIIDFAWQILDETDKDYFLKHYSAAWMSYRVSIPVENAQKIVTLADSGQLTFESGSVGVNRKTDGKYQLMLKSGSGETQELDYDMVVGAFGSPRDPYLLDSKLVNSLLTTGLARAHKHGGLDVEPTTGQMIDQYGRTVPNIFVIGELTSGVHFFTSVLEINARHTVTIARHISEALQRYESQDVLSSVA
jgi:uncharacterized NAD(P)/FAD-binding protein YdhS